VPDGRLRREPERDGSPLGLSWLAWYGFVGLFLLFLIILFGLFSAAFE